MTEFIAGFFPGVAKGTAGLSDSLNQQRGQAEQTRQFDEQLARQPSPDEAKNLRALETEVRRLEQEGLVTRNAAGKIDLTIKQEEVSPEAVEARKKLRDITLRKGGAEADTAEAGVSRAVTESNFYKRFGTQPLEQEMTARAGQIALTGAQTKAAEDENKLRPFKVWQDFAGIAFNQDIARQQLDLQKDAAKRGEMQDKLDYQLKMIEMGQRNFNANRDRDAAKSQKMAELLFSGRMQQEDFVGKFQGLEAQRLVEAGIDANDPQYAEAIKAAGDAARSALPNVQAIAGMSWRAMADLEPTDGRAYDAILNTATADADALSILMQQAKSGKITMEQFEAKSRSLLNGTHERLMAIAPERPEGAASQPSTGDATPPDTTPPAPKAKITLSKDAATRTGQSNTLRQIDALAPLVPEADRAVLDQVRGAKDVAHAHALLNKRQPGHWGRTADGAIARLPWSKEIPNGRKQTLLHGGDRTMLDNLSNGTRYGDFLSEMQDRGLIELGIDPSDPATVLEVIRLWKTYEPE